MSEITKHIIHTYNFAYPLSWCGQRGPGWAFVSLDHAAYANLNGERIVPCGKCVEAAVKALTLYTGDEKDRVTSKEPEPRKTVDAWTQFLHDTPLGKPRE